MKKRFILALQPHEAFHTAWSPRRLALSFCLCLALMGLAFSITIDGKPVNPETWQEALRVGLLTHAYGWQASPLINQAKAGQWYSEFYGKPLKTGCPEAPERDWKVICPIINEIDCDNAEPAGKAEILKNIRKSKTTYQYQCLYG